MDLLNTVRKEGSRGGRGDFKWEDVKSDSQRENYLGHSLMAPVGRWQKGKDLNWYAKGDDDADSRSAAEKLAEEKRKIKEAEEDAMLAAMGLPVPERASTNANLTPLGEKAHEAEVKKAINGKAADEEADTAKGERRHRRHRRDRDEDRRERRGKNRPDRDDHERRRRRESRSRSRDRHDRRRSRSRSTDRRRDRDSDRTRRRSRSGHRRPEEHDYRRRRRYSDDPSRSHSPHESRRHERR